jgi:hypothetical protein
MADKIYTVVRKFQNQIVERIGTFLNKADAEKIAEYKSGHNFDNRYEVVFSDVYASVDEFFEEHNKELLKSAKEKLTSEEWQAVTGDYVPHISV